MLKSSFFYNNYQIFGVHEQLILIFGNYSDIIKKRFDTITIKRNIIFLNKPLKQNNIQTLPYENKTIGACVFNQNLMDYNWQQYLEEAIRVIKQFGRYVKNV